MQIKHPLSFSPRRARLVARIEAGQRRRHRALHVALALGAGALALLAMLPAASQAQTMPDQPSPMQPAPPVHGVPGTMPPPDGMAPPPPPAVAPPPAPGVAPPPGPPPISQDPAVNVAAPATPPVPPPPAPTNAMVQQKAGPVTYVCGGVANDEQQALMRQARSYNMNLLFTQGGRGEYLSDVNVQLMKGGREVASFKADGPRCLVRAPAGTYNVRATYEGRTKTAAVNTSGKAVQMRW